MHSLQWCGQDFGKDHFSLAVSMRIKWPCPHFNCMIYFSNYACSTACRTDGQITVIQAKLELMEHKKGGALAPSAPLCLHHCKDTFCRLRKNYWNKTLHLVLSTKHICFTIHGSIKNMNVYF